jgi:hypothetical protein
MDAMRVNSSVVGTALLGQQELGVLLNFVRFFAATEAIELFRCAERMELIGWHGDDLSAVLQDEVVKQRAVILLEPRRWVQRIREEPFCSIDKNLAAAETVLSDEGMRADWDYLLSARRSVQNHDE